MHDPQIPIFYSAKLESDPFLDYFLDYLGLRQIKKFHKSQCQLSRRDCDFDCEKCKPSGAPTLPTPHITPHHTYKKCSALNGR